MNNEDIASKEEEIRGGLENALNRGENINIAVKSFINAGYPAPLVNMAANSLLNQQRGTVIEQKVPSAPQIPQSNLNLYAQKPNNHPQQITNQPQQTSNYINQQNTKSQGIPYWVIILMLILSLILLIGASILGVYWHFVMDLFGI